MARLRAWLEEYGAADVRTLLQSGNVVFRHAHHAAALEQEFAPAAEKDLGLRTDFFVRSLPEWENVIADNPFPREARDDPSHLVVVVLQEAPATARAKALRAAHEGKGREKIHVIGRQAYITYPDGIGRSKLTLAIIEKQLGTRGTGRNWNTVLKLAALACA
jgi:uncharacterized protein (DUF1697 family)